LYSTVQVLLIQAFDQSGDFSEYIKKVTEFLKKNGPTPVPKIGSSLPKPAGMIYGGVIFVLSTYLEALLHNLSEGVSFVFREPPSN
jgi:hypothetical protein